jgi:hypothetical protein
MIVALVVRLRNPHYLAFPPNKEVGAMSGSRVIRLGLGPIVGLVVLVSGLLSSSCLFFSFGDGMFRVGADIPAGTYRAPNPSGGCYWERLSGFSGSFAEVIANNFTPNTDIVTISPTDIGFKSESCGAWTANLAPITSDLSAPFGSGKVIVGVDAAPGTWRNSDSSGGCYWARLSGFGGTFGDIIANGYANSPQIVTIAPGDAGFESNGCGTWNRIG